MSTVPKLNVLSFSASFSWTKQRWIPKTSCMTVILAACSARANFLVWDGNYTMNNESRHLLAIQCCTICGFLDQAYAKPPHPAFYQDLFKALSMVYSKCKGMLLNRDGFWVYRCAKSWLDGSWPRRGRWSYCVLYMFYPPDNVQQVESVLWLTFLVQKWPKKRLLPSHAWLWFIDTSPWKSFKIQPWKFER